MSPDDPLPIVVAAVGLAVIATLAGLVAARRAARVDPAATLRCE